MNKQRTKTSRGIEWCDYTWNPVGGCFHGCAWAMPDGSLANCYAGDVARGVAQKAYQNGFEHHYWNPDILLEPSKIKKVSRIFVGSMTDLFGHWVPDHQIRTVIGACQALEYRHTFLLLTKNPKRLKDFYFTPNIHVGISAPPSEMWGKPLSRDQQERWFDVSLESLLACNAAVKWCSFEPLSYDISNHPLIGSLNWAVIGAASKGKKVYQPESLWVEKLLEALDSHDIPVFFKGNLAGNAGAASWREEFPPLLEQFKILAQRGKALS